MSALPDPVARLDGAVKHLDVVLAQVGRSGSLTSADHAALDGVVQSVRRASDELAARITAIGTSQPRPVASGGGYEGGPMARRRGIASGPGVVSIL